LAPAILNVKTTETLIVLKVSFRTFAPLNFEGVKEELLTKSAEMFLNLGVKSVTMDEIANEMGISKKTIYTHFSTKSKLVEATALYLFDNISAGIETIKAENRNPVEELYVIKKFAMELLKDEKSSPQYQLQKYYPKIFSTIKIKQQQLLEDLIQRNLRRGMELGLYREDLPLDFTGRIYVVGILGIRSRELFPLEDFLDHELLEKHLEYHLRAIVTPKGLEKLNELLYTNTQK
jgi:TetR/AcrR family transcriptional regulator, cholesterol catabolism regulator